MKRENKSKVIETNKLHIENKTIYVDLKENEGGKFVQIAELSNDRRSMVIIPETGVNDFIEVVTKMIETHKLNFEKELSYGS